ncbi:histone-like nucleoid-structuring protein Lsr2 [Motilibacter aurantiacus]|uniref:histone-like nucleoid-structuring protein Lsr2 n=1 Tax=Motilibacter aurantiacus TaxID=2714955 RepID=UPI0014072EED|nr:Lsr2 family protein [Motilibacter aurantiacus]NHC46084.1 Lsr2 family protein [Motilibacter aurantiacus]
MAQRVVTELIDDLDGKSAAAETVTFGLDGVMYEIDLSEEHAEELRTLLEGHALHGRRLPASRSPRRRGATRPAGEGSDPKLIRQWAQEQGYEVSARGRVSKALIEAYEAAH